MYQRIEVDRPAHAEGLRHQELGSVLVPKSLLKALDGRDAKVIGNTSKGAMPCALCRRKAQLLTDSRPHQKRSGRANESI